MRSIQMPNYLSGGHWLLAAAFALIFVLMAWDLSSDYADGVDRLHLAVEAVVLIVSGLGVVILAARQIRQIRRLHAMRNELAHSRDESARWRARYQDSVLVYPATHCVTYSESESV